MSRGAAVWLAALLLLAGCGGARVPADGRATGYTPGVPDFDLDAAIVLASGAVEVEALVSIPSASLVFVRDSSGFLAIARTAFRLQDDDENVLASASRTDTLRVATFARTVSFVPLVVRQRLASEPGALVLTAEVEDARTGRLAMRRLAVEVPDLADAPSVGTPRLSGVLPGSEVFQPLLSRGVPAGLDSFLVRFDVLGARGPLAVRAGLLRVSSDTTVAAPPSAFTPSPVSLRARGIDLGRVDTVFVSQQRIEAPDRSLTVEMALPSLRPGVYVLTMSATARGEREPFGSASRTFIVRPPGFPRLVGVEALVEPLAYIATPREMAALRAAGPDSVRYAFDQFWGNLFRDRRLAASALRAYFERVEEANRQFSSHTDGWKTDRGMVYILLGPPERVEDRFDSEVWTYGSAQTGGVFVFERTARRERDDTPFDVWTLVRDPAYDTLWRRAVRLWRSGQGP